MNNNEGVITVGFLDRWKLTEVPKTRTKKTFEERVEENIRDQIRIANGETLYGSKKGKDGKYSERKSWYDPSTGKIVVRLTNFPLNDGKGFDCKSNEDYKTFLEEFLRDWNTDPDLEKYVDHVRASYKTRLENLEKGRNK